MSATHTECALLPPQATQRVVCAQRIRVALSALQSIVTDSGSLSETSSFILKDMAESSDELKLEPDELARVIIAREPQRLQKLIGC